jgi:hypothetical protein
VDPYADDDEAELSGAPYAWNPWGVVMGVIITKQTIQIKHLKNAQNGTCLYNLNFMATLTVKV